ncbi:MULTISPECIES: exonuclease domain-containing protein [unclassified Variovorax]|uniref:exonuclease domain-containing protein n=1 Tax=unclassified Variovorax TaxID=663243 RepID=UPI000837E34E|nr:MULTISPECIES: exonuclease domain-containing protein [unclassified Variovorax]PNG47546.1 DNA polymerase III PolC-type [Variovorax sp. B2]PNG47803.1 DNA polymerase III PolC-type [Variovorax sp. B4]VTV14109.1 DNA polymerase III PolC-type [Variovorax sp. WDL1]
MDFTVIDVETANADMGSICQIGIARFAHGELAEAWSSLVDPEEHFDPINVSIHGLTHEHVAGHPNFAAVAGELRRRLENTVCVCHTHFDRVALSRAHEKYTQPSFSISWLDSARVVRRTWPEFSRSGYGLANVCAKLGYSFAHHDALEDAKAAGFVLVAAMRESKLDLAGWMHRVRLPINPGMSSSGAPVAREGNPEGPLHGEVLAFTGALSVPRAQAADVAARIGCEVAPGVTKRTTLLVVGDQDAYKLAGHEKSSKHRKAEEMVQHGHRLRIVRESDFFAIAEACAEGS